MPPKPSPPPPSGIKVLIAVIVSTRSLIEFSGLAGVVACCKAITPWSSSKGLSDAARLSNIFGIAAVRPVATAPAIVIMSCLLNSAEVRRSSSIRNNMASVGLSARAALVGSDFSRTLPGFAARRRTPAEMT